MSSTGQAHSVSIAGQLALESLAAVTHAAHQVRDALALDEDEVLMPGDGIVGGLERASLEDDRQALGSDDLLEWQRSLLAGVDDDLERRLRHACLLPATAVLARSPAIGRGSMARVGAPRVQQRSESGSRSV